jgi:hypothetical protein
MRNTVKIPILSLLVLALFLPWQATSQDFDLKAYRLRFNLETVKHGNEGRTLTATFIGQNKKDRKDRLPVHQAEIVFFNTLEDEEIELGKASTDDSGTATLTLPSDQKYLTDEEGYIEFFARFEGTKEIKKKEADLKVKDLFLEIEAEEIDSVKTVLVRAFALDSTNQRVPQDDVDLRISVRGMLSDFIVEEGSTEEGTFEIEFPDDIPGDVNGDFTMVAFVEDSDDFGNVEYTLDSDWGVFDDVPQKKNNELWTEVAPMWMYVILTIMLVGVWANYLYTIINIRKIKRLGS